MPPDTLRVRYSTPLPADADATARRLRGTPMLAGHVYLRAADTLIPAAVLGAEESAALSAAHASAREVPSGVYLEAANRSGSEILIERAVTRMLLHAQAVLRRLPAGWWV